MQINAYRYPECNVSVPENHTLFSHKYPSLPKMYYSYSSADPRSPLLLLAQAIKMCCIQKHGPFTQWYDIFLCKKIINAFIVNAYLQRNSLLPEVKKVRNWARDSLHFQNEHLQKGGEVLLLNLSLKDPIKSTETRSLLLSQWEGVAQWQEHLPPINKTSDNHIQWNLKVRNFYITKTSV